MQFAIPLFLLAGAAACGLLLALQRRLERARSAALREMAADHLVAGLTGSVSSRRRRIRLGLLLLAVASLFAALARPQAGFRWEEAHRKGIDIMLAIDTSKSMLATDVAPDRLERSKLAILDFVERLEGDRVGLIPFAGEAYLMCPLTLDYDAFRQSLATVDTEIVPAGGTDLANAIRVASKSLESEANHRILVLITDGEDLEGEAIEEAKRAAADGVTICTVGVGTPGGELIPKDGGFLKDEKGEAVRSRLDERTLRAIASATGGIYEPIGGVGGGLEAVYREKLSLVPKEELLARRHKVPLERFEWALALGGLALLLEMLLGDRKSARAWRLPKLGRAAAGAAVLLLASAAHASPADGERAFREGEFAKAAEQYRAALGEAPEDARLHRNLAAASYKEGDFGGAAESYRRALGTEDLKLQNEAYYGLGNTLFRQGQQLKDPKQVAAKWEEALALYEGALKLDPKDEDARFNRDLVRRKLDELRKQQEQQQKNEQKDQQKQDQQQDKDQKQDPQQGQQQQQDEQQSGQGGQQQKDQQQSGKDPQQKQQDGQQGQSQGPQQDQQQQGNQRQDPQEQQKDQQQAGQGEQQQDQQQAGQGPPRDSQGDGERPDAKDQEQGEEASGKPDKGEPQKHRSRLDPGRDGEKKPAGKAGQQAGGDAAAAGEGDAHEAGQMTREQARQLLDSLKEGEGSLAFVPQHSQANRKHGRHRRDW